MDGFTIIIIVLFLYWMMTDLYESKCERDVAIKEIELEIEKEKTKQKSDLYK